MNASKLTQQQTIINALERGDVAVLDVLSKHDLHDLEYAAECWGAANARRLILDRLDVLEPEAAAMVALLHHSLASRGVYVPLAKLGVRTDLATKEGPDFMAGATNCIDPKKAPTEQASFYDSIRRSRVPAVLGHLLPTPFARMAAQMHAAAELEHHNRMLALHCQRPGIRTVREALQLLEEQLADPVKLDAEAWRAVSVSPWKAIPESARYVRRLKAERQRLLKAHGYHLRRDEDGYGQHWVSPRGVPLKVRRRLAKLARMIDMASGKRPDCLDAYAFELQCRAPGISNRTLDRWLNAINPV